MAMSKKCFGFVLCLVVAIIIGSVVFVIIQMKQHGNDTKPGEDPVSEEDTPLISTSYSSLDPQKATMMCEMIENGTEPTMGTFNHPDMYHATIGVSGIGIRVAIDDITSDTYQKNAYWLTGDQFADRLALSMIRAEACRGKVPVIVIKMRPREGLTLSRSIQVWNHYQPKPILESWSDYDKKLNSYLKYLAPIPSLVILEPDLLMFSYDHNNLQYGWLNDKYKEEFYIRAQRVIKVMSRAWVYVDAGNADYLKGRENMEKMAKSLLRLDGLRGFSINTAHFFNTSYNNMMARRLHCLTGLHYIADTSRNGGPFSRQSTDGIQKCFFDPPNILRGLPPGWSWGIKLIPRQKRWVAVEEVATSRRPQTHPRTQPTSRSATLRATSWGAPPDPQQNPEAYNNYINGMRNNNGNNQNNNVNYNTVNSPSNIYTFGGSNNNPSQPPQPVQPQPNNFQPNTNRNPNMNNPNSGNTYNDLQMPSGRVPLAAITPPPTKTTVRTVTLRSKEEALSIFREKTMRRGKCLRLEPVRVHDANVWIKAPGESDGRMYPYGTYHKCLLGHTQACAEQCRLILNTEYDQRIETCGCDQRNSNDASRNPAPAADSAGVFFPESNPEYPNSVPNPPAQNPGMSNSNIPDSYSSLSDILERAGKRR